MEWLGKGIASVVTKSGAGVFGLLGYTNIGGWQRTLERL